MKYYVFAGLDEKSQRIFAAGKINHIFDSVCKLFEVTPEEVKSHSRKRMYAEPRQIIMYFLRNKFGLYLKEIGELFGNRDHSTVFYSIGLVEEFIQVDKRFKAKIEQIEELL